MTSRKASRDRSKTGNGRRGWPLLIFALVAPLTARCRSAPADARSSDDAGVCSSACLPLSDGGLPFFWGIADLIVGHNAATPLRWDVDRQLDQLLDLHPQIARVAVNLQQILKDANELKDVDGGYLQKYDRTFDRLEENGVVVVALIDQPFVPWMTGTGSGKTFPARGPTPEYQAFLKQYETAVETVARRFPSVHIWETGNEPNFWATNERKVCIAADAGLAPDGGCASELVTWEQEAAIATDLTYYARLAVRKAHPPPDWAFVFMPGIGSRGPDGGIGVEGLHGIGAFIGLMYADIESGGWPTPIELNQQASTNPRDYFDGACWHPYVGPFDTAHAPGPDTWQTPNKTIFDVLAAHGDRGIPVLFSEYGYDDYTSATDGGSGDRDLRADWMLESVRLAGSFPSLWGITWFRLFDDPTGKWRNGEQNWGWSKGLVGVTYADGGIPNEYPNSAPPDASFPFPDGGFPWKPAGFTFDSIASGGYPVPGDLVASWEFDTLDGGVGGFAAHPSSAVQIKAVGGLLYGGVDADGGSQGVYLESGDLSSAPVATASVNAIEIRMTVFAAAGSTAQDGSATFRFITTSDPSWDYEKAIQFQVQADGKPRTYVLSPASLGAAWNGAITRFHLAPSSAMKSFVLDYIRFR